MRSFVSQCALKLAATVFISLHFQAFWPKWHTFFGHFKNLSVFDRKMTETKQAWIFRCSEDVAWHSGLYKFHGYSLRPEESHRELIVNRPSLPLASNNCFREKLKDVQYKFVAFGMLSRTPWLRNPDLKRLIVMRASAWQDIQLETERNFLRCCTPYDARLFFHLASAFVLWNGNHQFTFNRATSILETEQILYHALRCRVHLRANGLFQPFTRSFLRRCW